MIRLDYMQYRKNNEISLDYNFYDMPWFGIYSLQKRGRTFF